MEKVFFENPNHEMLRSLGMSMVDMHFHTNYSDCSVRIPSMLAKAKKLNIGVAVTDHNTIAGSIAAKKQSNDAMIIPGIEVSCIEGPHVLLYFYTHNDLKHFYKSYLEKKKNENPFMATRSTVPDLLDAASKYSCIKVAAHPFGYLVANSGLLKSIRKHYVDENVMKKIDGLEVICGAMNRNLNKKALAFALQSKKSFTGGTDGHALFQLGKTVTAAHADSVEEFLEAVRKKQNMVVGKETKPWSKIIPAGESLKAHMGYAIPSIKLQSELLYGRAVHLKGRMVCRIRRDHKKDTGIFGKT